MRLAGNRSNNSSATTQHLFHRTAAIDVDHIKARFNKANGCRSEIGWIGAHQLATDRMLLVGDMQILPRLAPFGDFNHKPVEHHLAQGIGCAETAGNDPHRPVAIAGKCRLNDRHADGHIADVQ